MIKIKKKISKISSVFIAVVLIAVFFILSVESPKTGSWHQQIVGTLISPIQKSVTFIGRGVSSVWNGYFSLVGVSSENIELNKQVSELEGRLNEYRELESENARLRKLMSFKNYHKLDTQGAEVIGIDPRGDIRAITVNAGLDDGVAVDMPVVTSRGLVGRIVEVTDNSSRVLLITDPNNAVDVLIQRSRARALLEGDSVKTKLGPNYHLSRLEYLARKSDVKNGDTIVTSGFDSVYPAGLPVGLVSDIKHNEYGVFKESVVVPFVDFDNLEEVLIVMR